MSTHDGPGYDDELILLDRDGIPVRLVTCFHCKAILRPGASLTRHWKRMHEREKAQDNQSYRRWVSEWEHA
jgi:hypothetical protein